MVQLKPDGRRYNICSCAFLNKHARMSYFWLHCLNDKPTLVIIAQHWLIRMNQAANVFYVGQDEKSTCIGQQSKSPRQIYLIGFLCQGTYLDYCFFEEVTCLSSITDWLENYKKNQKFQKNAHVLQRQCLVFHRMSSTEYISFWFQKGTLKPPNHCQVEVYVCANSGIIFCFRA